MGAAIGGSAGDPATGLKPGSWVEGTRGEAASQVEIPEQHRILSHAWNPAVPEAMYGP